jgi:hypothetical protein
MRFMVLLLILLLSWVSVLFVAWEAADGERVDAGDFGGMSMVKGSRSRRDQIQKERFSQNVCAWFLDVSRGRFLRAKQSDVASPTQGLSGFGFRDSQ